MFLNGRRYCDFVIWGPRTFLVERICADVDIWQNMADVAKCVMPELCVKYLSKKYVLVSNNDANKMCTVNVESTEYAEVLMMATE